MNNNLDWALVECLFIWKQTEIKPYCKACFLNKLSSKNFSFLNNLLNTRLKDKQSNRELQIGLLIGLHLD